MHTISKSGAAINKSKILNENTKGNKYRRYIKETISSLDHSRVKLNKIHLKHAKFFKIIN